MNFFLSSLAFAWHFLSICWGSQWSFQKHILHFLRNTVRKNVPAGKNRIPYHCRPISKFFPAICRRNSESFVKTPFHLSKKNTLLRKKVWSKIFYQLRTMSEKVSTFCNKGFSRLVKTAFSVSIGKFGGEFYWKEYFFFTFVDSGEETSGFLAKFRTILLKLRFFSCPWEHFEAKEFFRENILIFFGYWVTNFCLSVEKKTVEL